jgi:hypothetical protein
MKEEITVVKNGGRRPGAGRKPKAAELALAEQMDKVAPVSRCSMHYTIRY